MRHGIGRASRSARDPAERRAPRTVSRPPHQRRRRPRRHRSAGGPEVRKPRGGRPQPHLRGHPGHPGRQRRYHLRTGLPGRGSPRLRLRWPVSADDRTTRRGPGRDHRSQWDHPVGRHAAVDPRSRQMDDHRGGSGRRGGAPVQQAGHELHVHLERSVRQSGTLLETHLPFGRRIHLPTPTGPEFRHRPALPQVLRPVQRGRRLRLPR